MRKGKDGVSAVRRRLRVGAVARDRLVPAVALGVPAVTLRSCRAVPVLAAVLAVRMSLLKGGEAPADEGQRERQDQRPRLPLCPPLEDGWHRRFGRVAPPPVGVELSLELGVADLQATRERRAVTRGREAGAHTGRALRAWLSSSSSAVLMPGYPAPPGWGFGGGSLSGRWLAPSLVFLV